MSKVETLVKLKIEQWRETIREWDYHYHVLDKPLVSDSVYNSGYRTLQKLEEEYPEYADIASPTQRVAGQVADGFESVKHRERMLSIANIWEEEDLARWAKDNTGGWLYCCEPKYDGIAVSLTYTDGFLTRALTRGDGEYGEDITENVRAIPTVPLILRGAVNDGIVEVRGEVVIPKSELRKLNHILREKGHAPYSNCRNLAASTLRSHDSKAVQARGLRFYPYDIRLPDEDSIALQGQAMRFCVGLGFLDDPNRKICKTIDDVVKYYRSSLEWRDGLTYDIDGIVIKIDSRKAQKEYGSNAKSPLWAKAWKFPDDLHRTKLLSVDFQVGRSGVITPVAVLNPVTIKGVAVTRATLHNWDEIARLNLSYGDDVMVKRSAEVIPKIVEAIPGDVKKPIECPTECPECGGEIIKEGASLLCGNAVSCPAQLKAMLVHYGSRKAMRIDGLGEALVNSLVDHGLLYSPVDLYNLDPSSMSSIDGIGEVLARKTVENIQRSKKTTLAKFLYALGIPDVGEETARTLAGAYGHIHDLYKAKPEELKELDGIGDVVAERIAGYFGNAGNVDVIEKLLACGIEWETPTNNAGDKPLAGQTWVISGEFPVTREDIKNRLVVLGAKVANAVSSKTTRVLEGMNAGKKVVDAQRIGIPTATWFDVKDYFK